MAVAEKSDYQKRNPWLLIEGGIVIGRRSTADACKNAARRLHGGGPVIVKHERSGRTWYRRGGSWFSDRQLRASPGERRSRGRP